MTNFVGAGIIPVYSTFAEKFDISIQDVSYFTSIHVRPPTMQHYPFQMTMRLKKIDIIYRISPGFPPTTIQAFRPPACVAHIYFLYSCL